MLLLCVSGGLANKPKARQVRVDANGEVSETSVADVETAADEESWVKNEVLKHLAELEEAERGEHENDAVSARSRLKIMLAERLQRLTEEMSQIRRDIDQLDNIRSEYSDAPPSTGYGYDSDPEGKTCDDADLALFMYTQPVSPKRSLVLQITKAREKQYHWQTVDKVDEPSCKEWCDKTPDCKWIAISGSLCMGCKQGASIKRSGRYKVFQKKEAP